MSKRRFVMRTLLSWLRSRPGSSWTPSPNGTPRATNQNHTFPKSRRMGRQSPRTNPMLLMELLRTVPDRCPPEQGRIYVGARRGPRPIGIQRIGTIVCPRLQASSGDRFAELYAVQLRFALWERREIGGRRRLHLFPRFGIDRHQPRQHRAGSWEPALLSQQSSRP